MINKRLSEITLVDIQELVGNSAHEGKTIDFKQEISLETDKGKGEFLADVSSFANSLGGDFVIGISEEAGIAKEIIGFKVENMDEEKQKIENIVRDGIAPRITIDLKFIELGKQRSVLIVRVIKSWTSPNRVIFTGYSKTKDQFFARNSAGKYSLDVVELKNAFILSDTLIDKIKDFRIKRTSAIIAGDTPVPLDEGGKIILHLVPVESFSLAANFDVSEIIRNPGRFRPVNSGGSNWRINIDGVLTYDSGRDGKSHAYTQLYRMGIIEAVEAYILSDRLWEERGNEDKYIQSVTYELEILNSFKLYLSLLQELGANPPILIYLTLTGVKNFRMAINRGRYHESGYRIDRNILNLPEHLLENYSERTEDILRPIFDLIWNACGYQRSYNFDEHGNWIDQ